MAEIEERILETWDKEGTFQASLDNRRSGPLFSFYDGPPFANGVPHYGHLEQTTIKDTVTRYKTMRGFFVPRRVGWDTHGLPVEYAVEKAHGFKSKKDIIAYGIAKFNQECRDSVYKYKDVWEKMFRRVGRWADYSKTYSTLDDDYIESVWWVLKTLNDKGLLYKDFRSSPYCPRCATPLSNFELNQGYQDGVTDPSLYVMFKLKTQDAYMLGWTTTPWSLPGNAGLAVKPDAKYVYAQVADELGELKTLILARQRLPALNSDNYHIVKEVLGADLEGLEYEPLFKLKNLGDKSGAPVYRVWAADFVSIEEGSGVLHVAPAFGEDDLNLAKEKALPVFLTIDENGHVVANQGLPEEIAGKFFKDADEPIIAYLTRQKRVYAAESFQHTYPFCWRCDTPLLYYATDSWLVKVSELRDRLVANNQQINWVPEHIRDGRFGKWLEGARDWAISRTRFWGAPLPIWVTEDGEITVIGSLAELKERAVKPDKIGDLHRPYIDDVEIKTESGKIGRRIPEVFDCWFESGAMAYAQDHYPFKNKAEWEKKFPADFIAEAVDQTRGWFYTLHALATALFDKPAYKNVICSGWIVAADGEKLSKRKKNYAPMDEVFDQYGVDTMRFFMASSPLMNGEDTRFSVDFLRHVQRNVLMTLNNVYSFYKLYADVDGWQPKNAGKRPQSSNILDQWVLARLDQTINEVTETMDQYRLDKATRPLEGLLDDVSNWYVRRSRRRFWKSQNDQDKHQAYETLHYVSLSLCQLMAPFTPFLTDHIWRGLVQGTNLPESVHLSDWPSLNEPDNTSHKILLDMAYVKGAINIGLAKRAEAGIKVRQPLAKATILNAIIEDGHQKAYEQIVKDELNVKSVVIKRSTEVSAEPTKAMWQDPGYKRQDGGTVEIILDTQLTDDLKAEGLMRELVRHIQNARKKAGLNIDDRIELKIEADSKEVTEAIERFKETIFTETLTSSELTEEGQYSETVEVEGQPVKISLKRLN